MGSMRYRFFALALLAILPAAVFAQEPPKAAQPVVVELFTSEGCSSCPPADAILRQINGKRTEAGQPIIGISEHVTYWNSQGWRDPFSSDEYTQRQNAYNEHFRLESVYTPQMVVNGAKQVQGSDGNAVLHAIAETSQPSPLTVHIASATHSGNTVNIAYSVSGNALPTHGVDLFAVVTEDDVSSSVKSGENSGKNLTHVSVARNISRVASIKAPGENSAHLSLGGAHPTSCHVILFLQTPHMGPVLSADIAALQP